MIACAIVVLFAFALSGTVSPALAQPVGQYRGFWVDTFNTRLNNAADVTTIVERARSAGANAIFVQVRRRGDAWYLRGSEPPPEGVTIDAGFDPLAEVLAQAHGAGLEVHAFVTVGAVWNQTTVPASPTHVFSQHGFSGTGPIAGRANWLTRTRLPDTTQTSYGGYRFGTDFWLDFGHPDAAAYVAGVVLELVKSYEIDGLHLDRLQYPEIPGPDASSGNVGYNDVSLERFRRREQRPSDSDPAPNDPAWADWRRAQVTSLLRRIYLEVMAIRPRVKVSVGVVATGTAPDSEEGWHGTDAYARVFQDWRSWAEEGLLDLVMPLAFRAEHTASDAEAFNAWVRWTRDHQYQRQALIGLGAYLNSIEGTLRQIRLAIEPAANPLDGVVLYSLGAHNAPVTRNPFGVPAGRDTPLRPFEDLSAGLRTGRTVSGQALENVSVSASGTAIGGVFATGTPVPLSTTTEARRGHLLGTIKGGNGQPIDSAQITLEGEDGSRVTTRTDGSGVYGRADLAAGTWRVIVEPIGDGRYVSDCTVAIATAQVAVFDLSVSPGRPGVAACQLAADSRVGR